MGLRHLQQLGQQIQSPDLPAREDNVGEWIEEMKEEWRHDVEVLKAWVAKPLKMTPARPGCANTAPTLWKSWLRRKLL